VVDAYNLAYAVLLLTGGLLADLWGRKRVFMLGAALFTASSLVCTFAPNVGCLIVGRTAAGLGAALMIPASLAILRVVWSDPRERGRALGIWTGCYGLAMVVGPTAGGVLLAHFGWRSIFVMVVPLSLAALVLASRVVPESADRKGRAFDATAQVAGALALGCLAFGAIEFNASPVIAGVALLVAALAGAAFVRIEGRQGAAALVPLDMLRIRPFRGAAAGAGGMTFGMYGLLFVLPLYWQSSGQLDAVGVGLALLPLGLIYVLVSPFSGRLGERLGVGVMTGGGVAVIALGVLLVALSPIWNSLPLSIIGLTMTGLGMGIATGPLTAVAVGAVGPERSGTASSIVNVVRMTGATLGVAVLGAVFARAGSGPVGLAAAMGLGCLIQIAGAATAWCLTRR
jgi:EmrB/QacA subfamily drug resistance transporter